MHNESVTSLQALREGYESLLLQFPLSPWDEFQSGLVPYLELLREWNEFSSLVSVGDVGPRLFGHVADSLALVPFFCGSERTFDVYLDIGSGSGFPAIPLNLALPGLPSVLVERSSRKVSFLKKVVGKCCLSSVSVVLGEFPQSIDAQLGSGIITARSVEKPHVIGPQIASFMRPDSLYLCQNGDVRPFPGPDFVCNVPSEASCSASYVPGSLTLVRRTQGKGV